MKKRNLLIVITIIFWVASLVTGFAASDRELPLLVDDAGLLSSSEEKSLNSELERISKEYKCEVAIVTVDYTFNKTATEYADDFFSGKRLIVSLVIGVIIALIITGIMKGQLKSVRYQPAATSYLRDNSFNLKVSRDLFLYSRITRQPKPKSSSSGSSTHTSSSGRTHGGSSRKF